MAEGEGFESALQCESSNMQGDGWHKSTWRTLKVKQTDRLVTQPINGAIGDIPFLQTTQD